MAGKERRHGAGRRAAEGETAPTPGTRQPKHPTRIRTRRREPKGARGRRRRLIQDGGQMGGQHPRSAGNSQGGENNDDAGHLPAQTPVTAQAALEGATGSARPEPLPRSIET